MLGGGQRTRGRGSWMELPDGPGAFCPHCTDLGVVRTSLHTAFDCVCSNIGNKMHCFPKDSEFAGPQESCCLFGDNIKTDGCFSDWGFGSHTSA